MQPLCRLVRHMFWSVHPGSVHGASYCKCHTGLPCRPTLVLRHTYRKDIMLNYYRGPGLVVCRLMLPTGLHTGMTVVDFCV
jgi:hypothetical protein